MVSGPEEGPDGGLRPIIKQLTGVSEGLGIGTIFLNEQKIPRVHLHSAYGRNSETVAGCSKQGAVNIWHIGEVLILELINTSAIRKIDPKTGYELLEV